MFPSRILREGGRHPRPINAQKILKDGSLLRISGYGTLWFDGQAPLASMAYGLRVWIDGDPSWVLCGSLVDTPLTANNETDWLNGKPDRCPDRWLHYSYMFRKKRNSNQVFLGAASIPDETNPQVILPLQSDRVMFGPAYEAHMLCLWAATLPPSIIHRVLHDGYAWKYEGREDEGLTWILSRHCPRADGHDQNQTKVLTEMSLQTALRRQDYVVLKIPW